MQKEEWQKTEAVELIGLQNSQNKKFGKRLRTGAWIAEYSKEGIGPKT
jgi:hypothetical protein